MHETSLAELWMKGGWFMYPLTLLGLAALGCSLLMPMLSLGKKSNGALFGLGLFIAGLALIALGFGAEALAMRNVDAAIAMVNPADRETIRYAGQSEAAVCRIYGFVLALLPLASGVFTVGLGFSRRDDSGAKPLPMAFGALAALAILIGGFFGFQAMAHHRAELEAKVREMVDARDHH